MATNDGFEYVERVGSDADGRTVLDYLAARYRHSSAVEWKGRIEDGCVLVDDRRVTPSTRLGRGQRLVWRRPGWEEPAAPEGFAILYRDGDLLGVAKPAGLPTLPGGGFLKRTLLHQVRARIAEASPVHRLGRFTSGLVLFALHPGAHAALCRAFALRQVGKRYRALAVGDPATDAFEIRQPIGPVPHPLLGQVHAVAANGKAAASRVEVLERRDGTFLCDVSIATGRPHQIRIHLAAAGHPLVGDPLYTAGGLPAPGSTALPGDGGYLLHASALSFTHPRTGRQIVWSCGPPPALRRG